MSRYKFDTLSVGKGYAGPLAVDLTWEDGTTRAAAAVTGTLRVYTTPPTNGVGGTTLFTAKTLSPTGSPANRLACTIAAVDVAVPGSYYAEIDLAEGAVKDALWGQFVIEGR
jgi:hypothetical protein